MLLCGCVSLSNQIIKQEVSPEEKKLINQISSPDEETAKKAIYILGRQDRASQPVVKKYEQMFKTYPDFDRLEMLLDAIYTYENQVDFLSGLVICLNSNNEDIREEALDIITDIEDKRAVDVLINALSNPYPDVREEARDALEILSDKSFDCQPRWRQWWEKNRADFQF